MIDPEALQAARARLSDWPDWDLRHGCGNGPVRSPPKRMASPPPPDQRVSFGTESEIVRVASRPRRRGILR